MLSSTSVAGSCLPTQAKPQENGNLQVLSEFPCSLGWLLLQTWRAGATGKYFRCDFKGLRKARCFKNRVIFHSLSMVFATKNVYSASTEWKHTQMGLGPQELKKFQFSGQPIHKTLDFILDITSDKNSLREPCALPCGSIWNKQLVRLRTSPASLALCLKLFWTLTSTSGKSRNTKK